MKRPRIARKPVAAAATVLFGAALALAAGCGGGGGAGGRVASVVPVQAQTGGLKVTISVPKRAASDASHRRAQYVSANTKSITLQTDAMTIPAAINLTLGGSDCPASGDSYQCTEYVPNLPVTSTVLTVDAYDDDDGGGNLLSSGQQAISIAPGGVTPISIVLDGVVASFDLVASPDSVTSGTAADITVTWNPHDASGALIPVDAQGTLVDATGAAVATPTLALSDTTDFSLSSATPDASRTWSVHYDGGAISSDVGLTMSVSGFADTLGAIHAAGAPPPVNLLVNGSFETGDFTGWYECYTGHTAYSGPIDPSTTDGSSSKQTDSAAPTADPSPRSSIYTYTWTPSPTSTNVPPTSPPGNPDGTYVARVGQPTGEPNGQQGICQNVAIPSDGTPWLSFWEMDQAGASGFVSRDNEADIFTAAAGLSEASPSTTAVPDLTLFAQNLCFYPTASSTSACLYGKTGGGMWFWKGPYDLSAYKGQTVTIFFGYFHATTSTYYDEGFWDGAQLVNAVAPPTAPPTP